MRLSIIVFFAITLIGCQGDLVRNLEVNQGRDPKDTPTELIKVDMDFEQVRDLLGPPNSRWNLDGEIWIYYFKRKDNYAENSSGIEIKFQHGKVIKTTKLVREKIDNS